MNEPTRELMIGGRSIGDGHPTYFIADIAANHDGDLERAKALIWAAKEAGADAAKFQHFKAQTIVSDVGFRQLHGVKSHQSGWNKSVFEVYQDASVSLDWTPALKATCDEARIDFFTSPYAKDLVDAVDPYVPAYKIGSGDITWTEIIEYIAGKGKPYILATGASTLEDVQRAVRAALSINPQLALMQCNTNYTGSIENMRHVQLNVLRTYRALYPHMVLGLSDHTPGHATVLGAVTLGAKMVEKHFTQDQARVGPDHAFSMDPRGWRDMVDRTRELEAALGSEQKRIEPNESETVVLQRRAVCAARDLDAGQAVAPEDMTVLRPCPAGALPPYRAGEIVGRRLRRAKYAGQHFELTDFE